MSTIERPVVLITGASRGIGRAIADALAGEWRILVGGTRLESVQPAVDALPDAAPFVADLTDPTAVGAAVAQLDRLNAVVHSAGVSEGSTVEETSREQWAHQFELNVVAVADLTRMLLPLLRASRGHVVAINSGSGFTSNPGNGPYSASKFALRAFTDALREEERGRLRVTSIHPGRVDTDMQRQIQERLGHEYQPEKYLKPSSIAAAVKLALDASEDATVESVAVRPSGLPRSERP
ncbi:SDR family oxidoreductase [Propionimicrobium sp. PCR01-08-3]|uniref:SDR family oxidoreductase n=1 Tax=Propionimicrobium sp. PCR01-08-3 TaxID=3052086 RepID=UPI00255CE3C0|nr:SDR family oxidoreductase [Propionimicrobium sp. PCR01-08-3]WIY81914.1 SDR family oxidoreductase [Propionimicrobium sp. PCR01-08-3]